MANVALNPYLFFTGDCKQAMEFYQSVFGGSLEIVTFADYGQTENPDNIMHANLKGGLVEFMGSDGTRTTPYDISRISMALGGSDAAAMTEAFNKLSEGGKVDQALGPAPWGGQFGMCTDKFGIDWMVNIEG